MIGMQDQGQSHQRRLPPAERGRAQDRSRDDAIIAAALELLADKGYHALTMTDVAARAGVSKATLYRRWTAKADLVADAVATLSPLTPPSYPGTSLRNDLLALIEQAGTCDGNPELVTATYEMARSHPDLYQTLSERMSAYLRVQLSGFAARVADAGGTPPTGIEVEALCDTIVALLAHYGGPAGKSVPHKRLTGLVDHVLMILLTGKRATTQGA